MDYCVALYFDADTEKKFTEIIKAVAETQNNSYMLEKSIPPHITISYFQTENVDDVVTILDNHNSDFISGDIFWASLGSFIPEVVFAAPVFSEYLLNACSLANRLLEKVVEFCGFYLPYQWVPHTTLATKLSRDELGGAFNAAAKHFTAFGGKSDRIVLCECNPYKELQTWSINTES